MPPRRINCLPPLHLASLIATVVPPPSPPPPTPGLHLTLSIVFLHRLAVTRDSAFFDKLDHASVQAPATDYIPRTRRQDNRKFEETEGITRKYIIAGPMFSASQNNNLRMKFWDEFIRQNVAIKFKTKSRGDSNYFSCVKPWETYWIYHTASFQGKMPKSSRKSVYNGKSLILIQKRRNVDSYYFYLNF